ncbi:hypothetical protein BTVI_85296 [Pitangus sulphuratus]|nr:hypothetical protein BTVI_85296 [Pitangus sulphuratus]
MWRTSLFASSAVLAAEASRAMQKLFSTAESYIILPVKEFTISLVTLLEVPPGKQHLLPSFFDFVDFEFVGDWKEGCDRHVFLMVHKEFYNMKETVRQLRFDRES